MADKKLEIVLATKEMGKKAWSNVNKRITTLTKNVFSLKGAFVGLSLEGAVVNTNYEWNKTYYGKPVKPVDIFVGRSVSNPESAELRSTIARLAK